MATNGDDNNPGTEAQPVKTINRAVSLAPAGGTIVVRGGTYRDWHHNGANYQFITKSGLTLQAYPHEQAWFDGADVVASGWTSVGAGRYVVDWSTPSFCGRWEYPTGAGHYYDFDPLNQPADNTGPCSHWDVDSSALAPTAGDPQAAWLDGHELNQVESLSKVTDATSFYYDWANRKLYMGTNPSGHTVELTARPVALLFNVEAHIKGIGFRHYATNEHESFTSGAVYLNGQYASKVDDSTFFDNSATGLSLSNPAPGAYIKGSVFAYNGVRGIGINGSTSGAMAAGKTRNDYAINDTLVEGNAFYHNNDKDFGEECSASCGSAQIKMNHMNGYTFKGNYLTDVVGSKGSGVWCDTDCLGGVVINNLLVNSGDIFYELADGGIIVSNVTIGAKYSINVVGKNLKVYNNTIVSSGSMGMRIYDESRMALTGQPSSPSSHPNNLEVVNNVQYQNGTPNLTWLSGKTGGVLYSDPAGWFALFDDNSYWHQSSSDALYRIINQADTSFRSVAALRSSYAHWEANATETSNGGNPFVNLAGGDYRISPSSAAYHSGAAIPADIADKLGISTAAGQSRGAISWPGSQ